MLKKSLWPILNPPQTIYSCSKPIKADSETSENMYEPLTIGLSFAMDQNPIKEQLPVYMLNNIIVNRSLILIFNAVNSSLILTFRCPQLVEGWLPHNRNLKSIYV